MMPEIKLAPQPPIPSKQNGHAEAVTAAPFADAPYSWTVTAVDEHGFSEMFTVRAVTVEGFLARIQQLKSNLLDLGYKPAPTRPAAAKPAETNEVEPAPICAIHKTPMVKRQSARGSFWSCNQKLEDGTWCPYRPPKA